MSDETRVPDPSHLPKEGGEKPHPVGTVVGMIGGARAGMAIGGLFGSIGKLVGAAAGAVIGSGAGKAIAETVNPQTETEYWRQVALKEIEFGPGHEFDRDYLPAYQLGWEARNSGSGQQWNDELEADLQARWNELGSGSHLDWEKARKPVKDAWERTDRTHQTYEAIDRHFEENFDKADYYNEESGHNFDDYRSAYRFGTYARSLDLDASWEAIEEGLAVDWELERGDSTLTWEEAKPAIREAWENSEHVLQKHAAGRLG